jgi:hypothetical protein
MSTFDPRALENAILQQMVEAGLPEPKREVEFYTKATCWRFDLAYPDLKMAVEVDGVSGEIEGEEDNHLNPRAYARMCIKTNEANIAGWQVIRLTAAMILGRKRIGIDQIKAAYSAAVKRHQIRTAIHDIQKALAPSTC